MIGTSRLVRWLSAAGVVTTVLTATAGTWKPAFAQQTRAVAPPPGRPPQPAFDPTGTYDLAFTDNGQPMSGTMVVRGTPGDYTGTVNAQGRPEVAITTLTASGPQVTVTGDIPNGILLIRFRVTGDSIRGDWSLRGQGGRLVGKHSPAARK